MVDLEKLKMTRIEGDCSEKMIENGTVGYMSVFKFGIFTVLFLIAE